MILLMLSEKNMFRFMFGFVSEIFAYVGGVLEDGVVFV